MYMYIYTYIIQLSYTPIHIYACVYTCMYVHILSSSRKRPDGFVYSFHRRDSRGPVADGNHSQIKPTTETINKREKTFLATTETIEKPTTETIQIMLSCQDGNHNLKNNSDGNQS